MAPKLGAPGWRLPLPEPLLALSPFADWNFTPLAGDASARRYARLTGPDGQTAIFMDMGNDNPRPFLRIAHHLEGCGLCVPEVLWTGERRGIFVLSDLGLQQFAEWLRDNPADEEMLYAAAVDVLIALQAQPAPDGLVLFDPQTSAAMIAPLFEWHAPHTKPDHAHQITAVLQESLERLAPDATRLALRDYHAENLIWRKDRDGTDRVGLLDFQDAVIAPPEYDLVSLLRDARRDVPDALRIRMMERFAAGTGRDMGKGMAAAAALGVQRNLRIMGIFARLAARDGKTRYLDLLPRVRRHVMADLKHPDLASLRAAVTGCLPEFA
jgi:N-acetylmuramate 1-kinase